MKEPIEEIFKESLKGHEMPYNPKAWEAMSARLDAVKPVAKPASNLKYYLGAAAIGAVAVATYFIFAGGDTPENAKDPVAKQETTLEQTTTGTTKPSSGNSEAQTGDASVISNPDETPSSTDERLQGSSVDQSNTNTNTHHTAQSNSQNSSSSKNENTTNGTNNENPNDGVKDVHKKPINDYSNTVSNTVKLPAVADLCLNEETVITNENDRPLYILDAVNEVVGTVPANKAVVFKPSVVGNYTVAHNEGGIMKSGSNFVVNRVPDAHFTVDLVNKYENGLPATRVEAIGGQGTYVWTAEKQSSTGVQTDLRFFEKGSHTIKLTVDNGQCLSSFEKTIYVEEDYNLMAVNGFTPTSMIPQNQTFMPFALTERPDVDFELTILDSRDGGTVYRTTDASLPWDGTDMRSGRRSETTQVYIWKVVILNPKANEPSEYKGTITMNIAN